MHLHAASLPLFSRATYLPFPPGLKKWALLGRPTSRGCLINAQLNSRCVPCTLARALSDFPDVGTSSRTSDGLATQDIAAPNEYPYPAYHYVARLKYDGSRFYGFQIQHNTGRLTIQAALEKALVKASVGEPVAPHLCACTHVSRPQVLGRGQADPRSFVIRSSGRTDAGVHARDQHVQFTAPRPWQGCPVLLRGSESALKFAHALNTALPPDIRVFEACASCGELAEWCGAY